MQADLDRQYLKAMGIDLWVTRDAAEPSTVVPDTAVTPKTDLPVRQWSAAQLQQSIANLAVEKTVASQADLLVVTEGAGLSEECAVLLGSMFKAIKIDPAQWLHVGTAIDQLGKGQLDEGQSVKAQSESLNALADKVNPKAIVLMVRSAGNSLDALRGVPYQSPTMAPLVAVTFHPQDLLDNPETKRPAWEDLKQLRQWLG